jgi:hypothetical protein
MNADMLPRLILLLFLSAFCSASVAAEIDALLDKVAAAYATGTARGAVQGLRQTGVTYSSTRGAEGTILRAFQRPDRLLVEIRYAQDQEVRLLRGPHAWKQGEPMGGTFRGAMRLQAARMELPWNLLEGRGQLRDKGSVEQGDGHSLRILELPLGAGVAFDVGIDPQSGRIVRSLGRLAGSMGVMEFGTAYEDFRYQDGRLYAAMERHFAQGELIGYTRIDKLEFLDSLPDELFAPLPVPAPRLAI